MPGTILGRGRVALAQKHCTEAAADFRRAQALFVDSGGAAHPRRWLAQGLAALAAAETHPAQMDRNALQGALDALAAPPSSLTAERAELLLQVGASTPGLYARGRTAHSMRTDHGQKPLAGGLGRALIADELQRTVRLDAILPTPRATMLNPLASSRQFARDVQ